MYGPDYHYDCSDYPQPLCEKCGGPEGDCGCLKCDICEKPTQVEQVAIESLPTHGDSIIKSTYYCRDCWEKKKGGTT